MSIFLIQVVVKSAWISEEDLHSHSILLDLFLFLTIIAYFFPQISIFKRTLHCKAQSVASSVCGGGSTDTLIGKTGALRSHSRRDEARRE